MAPRSQCLLRGHRGGAMMPEDSPYRKSNCYVIAYILDFEDLEDQRKQGNKKGRDADLDLTNLSPDINRQDDLEPLPPLSRPLYRHGKGIHRPLPPQCRSGSTEQVLEVLKSQDSPPISAPGLCIPQWSVICTRPRHPAKASWINTESGRTTKSPLSLPDPLYIRIIRHQTKQVAENKRVEKETGFVAAAGTKASGRTLNRLGRLFLVGRLRCNTLIGYCL
ncbi:hypothetical protein V8F06_002181 [Rhypophila decipiens]